MHAYYIHYKNHTQGTEKAKNKTKHKNIIYSHVMSLVTWPFDSS